MKIAMSETLGKIVGIPEFSVDDIVLDFIVVPDDSWFEFTFNSC